MKDFKFKLFNTTWKVKFVDRINTENPQDSMWIYGITRGYEKVIEVATKNGEGIPYSNNEIILTLYHEIFHAIFKTGAYTSSDDDEPLVEWCANCLYSLKEQKVL